MDNSSIEITLPPSRKIRSRSRTKIQLLTEQIDELKYDYLAKYAKFKIGKFAKLLQAKCSPKCPFFDGCNKNMGETCQREEDIYHNALYSYFAELEISPQFPTEVLAASELAALDVLEARCYEHIGQEGMLTDRVIGVSMEGNPIETKDKNPSFEILRLVWNRRTAVMEQLSATRNQKAKLAAEVAGKITPVELFSKLRAEMDLRKQSPKMIEAQVVDDGAG